MFDVGFWELLLIFGMGLMILGPERMPRVAAQVGRWIGRAQRTANQFRRKLQRELELEDLVRDGIVPRHRHAARPKTTTRTGNTPTTVPTNARKSEAEKESEALREATSAASAEQESTEQASGDTPESQQRQQPVGGQDPGPEPSQASARAGEAPEAREAGSQ